MECRNCGEHIFEEASQVRARPKTSLEKIAQLEAELDTALAAEADPVKRNRLINDHNAKLRRLDIRYRRTMKR